MKNVDLPCFLRRRYCGKSDLIDFLQDCALSFPKMYAHLRAMYAFASQNVVTVISS